MSHTQYADLLVVKKTPPPSIRWRLVRLRRASPPVRHTVIALREIENKGHLLVLVLCAERWRQAPLQSLHEQIGIQIAVVVCLSRFFSWEQHFSSQESGNVDATPLLIFGVIVPDTIGWSTATAPG